MSDVTTQATIKVYEHNAAAIEGLTEMRLTVKSHWNRSDMVVVTVEEQSYTVCGAHLRAAIQKCEGL